MQFTIKMKEKHYIHQCNKLQMFDIYFGQSFHEVLFIQKHIHGVSEAEQLFLTHTHTHSPVGDYTLP